MKSVARRSIDSRTVNRRVTNSSPRIESGRISHMAPCRQHQAEIGSVDRPAVEVAAQAGEKSSVTTEVTLRRSIFDISLWRNLAETPPQCVIKDAWCIKKTPIERVEGLPVGRALRGHSLLWLARKAARLRFRNYTRSNDPRSIDHQNSAKTH